MIRHICNRSFQHRPRLIAAIAAVLVAAPAAAGAVIQSTYVGPDGGAWSNPNHWSPVGVPNNGMDSYEVFIDSNAGADKTVVYDASATIDALTIDLGDTLEMQSGRSISILENADINGTLHLGSIGHLTDLILGPTDVNFNGTGILSTSDNYQNRIYGASPANRLVHGASHTIRGSGQLGVNLLLLTNHGLIEGTQSNELRIDLSSTGQSINPGTIQSRGGGRLRLYQCELDNTGGEIAALDDGSITYIDAAGVSHGTLQTTGNGRFELLRNGTLRELHNNAAVHVSSGNGGMLDGTIVNDGEFRMDSIGHHTDLQITSDGTTLTGSGAVVGSANVNNRIYGPSSEYRLVNDVGHTIRGGMQLGVDQLVLTNRGLIDADLSNIQLRIDCSALDTTFNTGVIQASNGGQVILFPMLLDNSGGVIQALDGSLADLDGVHVIGGDLDSAGTGRVRAFGNAIIEDLTNLGVLEIPNGHTGKARGTITNPGTFRFPSIGNWTDLQLESAVVTLAGSGEVAFSNNLQNRIYGTTNEKRLVNEADHTIRGGGQIGANQTVLTNHGTISAEGELIIDMTDALESFNDGVIQASDGGWLHIRPGLIDNTGGVIRGLDASTVDLETAAHIRGGQLNSAGSGRVRLTGGGAVIEDLANEGLLEIPSGSSGHARGTIVNNGMFQFSSIGHWTDLQIDSPVTTFAGTGEVVFSNNEGNRIYGTAAENRLVNEVDHTIRGTARLGADIMALTNRGTIISDAGMLTIDMAATEDFTNEGLLHITGTGAVTISPGGPFETFGDVLIDVDRTLTRQGQYTQTGGTTMVKGELIVTHGGIVDLQGGTLSGVGVVNSTVKNSSIVAPGASIGTLLINGFYDQDDIGVLLIELAGDVDYDVLSCASTADLSGMLQVQFVDNYVPPFNQTFTVMASSTLDGAFEALDSIHNLFVSYPADNVVLTMKEERFSRPLDFNVIFGHYESGAATSMHSSDDAYLWVEQRPAFSVLLPLIRVEVGGTAFMETPSELRATLEAAATCSPGLPPQRLSLRNYDSGFWMNVDERTATPDDSVVEVTITTDPDRFIEDGTGAMRMRIEWFDPGNVISPAWKIRIDEATWEVVP